MAVETPVVLRTLAIVLIVGTHADLFLGDGFSLKGGARAGRLLGAMAQVAVPAVLWIAAVALISGKYTLGTALLLNNTVPGDGLWNEQWQFWFLEAMVWSMAALALLFTIPAIDRRERRSPWAFALTVLAGTLAVRVAVLGIAPAEHVQRYALPTVLWCIALGWVIARADTVQRRVVATVLAAAVIPGFFGEPLREAIIALGAATLIWVPAVRLPAWLRPIVTSIAAASLFVYLTHWVVYPPFEQSAPLLGTLLSFAVGIAAWAAHRGILTAIRRARRYGAA